MEIFEKRGKWCFLEIIEDQGIRKLHKFGTKEEAMKAAGVTCACPDCNCDPCECKEEIINGSEEKEESSEKETRTDEQAPVLSSKSAGKKKV